MFVSVWYHMVNFGVILDATDFEGILKSYLFMEVRHKIRKMRSMSVSNFNMLVGLILYAKVEALRGEKASKMDVQLSTMIFFVTCYPFLLICKKDRHVALTARKTVDATWRVSQK